MEDGSGDRWELGSYIHPALGQGFSNHLDSRSHHLSSLGCLYSWLLLYLRLYLRLLDNHWSSDKFQLWLGIQHLSRKGLSL